jgi:hypothetical protein
MVSIENTPLWYEYYDKQGIILLDLISQVKVALPSMKRNDSGIVMLDLTPISEKEVNPD